MGKRVASQQEMIPRNSFYLVQVVVFRLPATFNSQSIDGSCEQNTFSHCMYRRRHFVSTSHMMSNAHAWLKSEKIHRPSKRTKRQVQGNLSLTSRGYTSWTSRRSQRGQYRETCRGNVDYRISGIPHSTVQKEDSNRKETVKRLIQQFENHPNRNCCCKTFNKIEEINPFSKDSKDWITDMGNTEYFELCDTSSKIQCPDCAPCTGKLASYTAHVASAGSLQKGIDRWKMIRRADNFWLCHQKESFPRCQTWTIYAADHVLQSTWYVEESPQQQEWSL